MEPTRLMDLQYQNCSTPTPSLEIRNSATVTGIAPPSSGGHQSALSCWHTEIQVVLEVTGSLASLSAEDGPEHAVTGRMTSRDEGRSNMRPTTTVCSIAPSRHCSAR
jgi:hypothetical protein